MATCRTVQTVGRVLLTGGAVLAWCSCAQRRLPPPPQSAPAMERVVVAPDRRGFALAPSGRPFVPWGFNYDHDERGRLLEEYWDAEWPKVVEDFGEMAALGANVVRIHLQLGRFMRAPDQPNPDALERLGQLLELAERTGLYLDLTGLGCYLNADVPPWYDDLGERERWAVQARFWEALAARCATSSAVFCYDLMNEPVVPGGRRQAGDWLGPPFAGKYHYVQFITLDQAERPRPTIARAWVRHLAEAIHRHDRLHLITIGLVDWSLDRPGLTSGFVPHEIAAELDLLSMHMYPEAGHIDAALETLAGFAVGKPVIIEETFPLRCGPAEFSAFLRASGRYAAGWIGFYWGKTLEECRQSGQPADQLMAAWLDLFQTTRPHARPAP